MQLRRLRDQLAHERRSVAEKLHGLDQQLETVEQRLRDLETPSEGASPWLWLPWWVAAAVQRVAEMLSGETQRSLERLGTQLQQRLSALAVAPGGAEHSMAIELAMEALHDAATENRSRGWSKGG
eukprot:Skav234777  [mRNA]  locus=scaffold2396:444925:451533:- [translate_table: standard]